MSARIAATLLLCLAACRREPHAEPAPKATPSTHASTSAPAPYPWIVKRARLTLASTQLSLVDTKMSRMLDGPFTNPRALAVINGGFFDPQSRPMGLAVSAGRTWSPLSKTMSGGVFWVRDGVGHLTASEDYTEPSVDFAVQCKPRLVVASARNIRSDDGKRAARTVLCLREAGRQLDVVLTYSERDAHDGPTLFEIATVLQAEGCEEALALDGGPSTGGVLRTAGVEERIELRGPIRHAIVFEPK